VVEVGERIADALIGRGSNSAAGGQGDAQGQRGEGGPALRPAPRGKLVAGRAAYAMRGIGHGGKGIRRGFGRVSRLSSGFAGPGRAGTLEQRRDGGRGLGNFGAQGAELQQGGAELAVVVHVCLEQQLVNESFTAGSCGVTHDSPGFF